MGMTYEQFEFQNLAWTLQNFNRNYHILVASDKICRKEYRSEIKLARVKKMNFMKSMLLEGLQVKNIRKYKEWFRKLTWSR